MSRFGSNHPAVSLIFIATLASACGSGTGTSRQVPNNPAGPSGGGNTGPVTLTAPSAVSPVNGEQLATLRPTLTVQNGTSSAQSGTRTYQFQVSDAADFSVGASLTASFLVTVNQTDVPEGPDGRTTLTVGQELQPATRMYWRARLVQGTSQSEWSQPAMFRTKLVGYNRPGELYDPLIHSESIGTVFGAHTWVPGKGLRLETENSYVQYLLAETMPNGEFSVEVEGLRPNGPDHKLKIFSMSDTTGDLTTSNFQMSTMYRGVDGNPPNCIAFKAVFGGRILEPNSSQRNASIMFLDPNRVYFWKETWGVEFRLVVLDGGVNGNQIYNLGFSAQGSVYRPSPPYAFLGSNQSVFNSDAGTFPGATYRNLFIGNKPRPTTLGNALD